MISMAYFRPKARNLPDHHRYSEGDLVDPPQGFPCQAIRLRAYEARALAFVANMDFGAGMSLMERQNICFDKCDAVALKTCREMEGAYCDFAEKNLNKQILLVGPVLPEKPSSKLDDQVSGWLDGFSHGSVVYCALGSECVLEKNQFEELVLGLELTGRPFLAALRPPKGCETIESALPPGYTERIKGRGIIHGGWVQQQLILHHPSVGCFITHCGAGSLSEGLLSECQLVLLPQAVDQFINARLMSLDLKVGVEVSKGEENDFFTRDAIYDAVTMAMEPESNIGRDIRTNHTKLRNVLLKQGLEESYISGFVRSLQDLLGRV